MKKKTTELRQIDERPREKVLRRIRAGAALRLRTVIEERHITERIESEDMFSAVPQIVDMLKWRLSVEAEEGTELGKTTFWLMKSTEIYGAGVPVVTLCYSIEEACVIIHGLRIDRGGRRRSQVGIHPKR